MVIKEADHHPDYVPIVATVQTCPFCPLRELRVNMSVLPAEGVEGKHVSRVRVF